MKFYKYVIHTVTHEQKEAWDHYGRMAGAGNTVQKPSTKGPTPKVIISNVKLTEAQLLYRGLVFIGAQRWSSS